MSPLRRFATYFAPWIFAGACAQIIGLSDYEKGEEEGNGEGGEATGGKPGQGGGSGGSGILKGGRGGTGTGGTARGGASPGGEAGDGGDGGVAGDTGGSTMTGGTSGTGQGGTTGGTGGTAGSGMGGMGGSGGSSAGNGGTGGSGMSGGGSGGSMVVCNNVPVSLRNANFDAAQVGWTVYTDPDMLEIIVPASSVGVTAETPPNIAHFGGGDFYYKELFQSIAIPANADRLTLTGYRSITTEETPSGQFDLIELALYADAFDINSLIDVFVRWSNLNVTNGWVQFSYSVDIPAIYAGQIIDIDIVSNNDVNKLTDFYLDSLALTARVCQ